MAKWDEAVARLTDPAGEPDTNKRWWHPFIRRTPVVVTGGPGAGKTEVWRQLTGGEAPDVMSKKVDKGYFFAEKRESIAIITIAGQASAERYEDLGYFFAPSTRLDGVVFVGAFGFDAIWPENARTVARSLDPFDVNTLSDRNIKRELESFRESCGKILEKAVRARGDPETSPRWLLVLANKADLYWDAIADAAGYYRPGCGSRFDEIAQGMLDELQPRLDYGFRYEAMPITLNPASYEFAIGADKVVVPTQLDGEHADASVRMLGDTLRDLCGV